MESVNVFINNIINLFGIFGPILACIFIFIESILPFLPLAVFITINFLSFGNTLGFVISWVFTVLGCLMSFYIFRKGVQGKFEKIIRDKTKLENFMIKINNISLGELVILLSVPFLPAFLFNIAAGLSKIKFKRYLAALIFGKIVLVYFWGYIGKSFVESFQDPKIFIKIILLIIAAYIVSKLTSKTLEL